MKSNTLYIASLEPAAGKLIVTMGLMEMLTRSMGNIAFFRPVIDAENSIDGDIELIRNRYCPSMQYEECYGFQASAVKSLVAEDKMKFFLEELLNKLSALKEKYDFVLCEGLNSNAFLSSFEIDINMEIAKNLGCPFVGVINGMDQSPRDVAREIKIAADAITDSGCLHYATFVNRMAEDTLGVLEVELDEPGENDAPVFLIPENEELDKPSLSDISDALRCSNVLERLEGMDRIVKRFKIAAMTMEHFLGHVEDGDLIIVPGDRDDIILASLSTLTSSNYPNIAGILLSGGFTPGPNTMRLISGRKHTVPLLSTEADTYITTTTAASVPALINAGDERKIALALGLFETHVESEQLEKIITLRKTPETVTPVMFEYGLFERARTSKKHIVLPEASDPRILRATEILLRRNVVNITLLGNPEEIVQKGAALGLDLTGANIIDPSNSELTEQFVQDYYTLRKHKNMTLDGARDAMSSPSSFFGTMMVYQGFADGMVSGAIHTTADTIRPALQIIKTTPGISVVSSVFLMCLDTKVLVYGDCAVNPDPSSEQLAEIAISSANTATTFGITPRVAMLSYSTGASGKGADVEKVREGARIAREKRPDLLLEGPIQYDAAIEPSVAQTKMPDSKVAGRATVFIFPDLNTGNNTYKAVQRSSGAVAIGPVLQGLKKPVNDLSRGCLVADIINTVAITAIQAQSLPNEPLEQ